VSARANLITTDRDLASAASAKLDVEVLGP